MLSTTEFCVVLLVVFQVYLVRGSCPYAAHRQYHGMLAKKLEHHNEDIDIHHESIHVYEEVIDAHEKYLSSVLSYESYETDCHRYVPQPSKVSDTILNHAFNESSNHTSQYEALDNDFISASNVSSPSFLEDNDVNNFFFESATRYVQETTCPSKKTTTVHLSTIRLENFINQLTQNSTRSQCNNGDTKRLHCDLKKFNRQVDGTCNNLGRPLEGRYGECMLRLLPPDYKDAISKLRTSIDGSPLPNPRLVSTGLFGHDEHRRLSTRYTQFHAFFGELVIGDNGLTLTNSNGMGMNLHCCDRDGIKRDHHPQCASFFVPPHDGVLGKTFPLQKCMEFVRSIPCSRCNLGPRMILNAVTSAQDLNSVYGVTKSMLRNRTSIRGCLKSQWKHSNELFAVERFNSSGRFRCLKGTCEVSPLDGRNALFPVGQAFALIFHRNHNRIARIIGKLNPHLNDDMILKKARKWNIAEYQHIIYNEYIRTLIGEKLTEYFRISPRPLGEFTRYEPELHLRTIIEFQSTAARQGHASLSEDMYMFDKSGHEFKVNFRNSELFESIFYDGYVDGMLFAIMLRPEFVSNHSIPFKSFLLETPGRPFGLDLAAIDIQRQRDHAMPGYIYYLKYCHDYDVRSWKDLKAYINLDNINKLKKYYKYVEDIELYVGGHYERKIPDGVVGPTFGCIIGIQFQTVKFGDRFFYEHGDMKTSFKIEELNEIKTKTSMASVLCRNARLEKVLANPFLLESDTNRFVHCSRFRKKF